MEQHMSNIPHTPCYTPPPYDAQNIFAKIIHKEIPCQLIHESPYMMAFYDHKPQAPLHIVAVPKGAYQCWSHFFFCASQKEIQEFFKGVSFVVATLNLHEKGFRLVANEGTYGGQEVPHFHMHILSGKALGPLLSHARTQI